jgi:hypothetical protein
VAGIPDRLHCDTHAAATVTRCPFAVLRNSHRLAAGGYTEAVAVADNSGRRSKDVVVVDYVVRREAGQQAKQCRDGDEGRECAAGEHCSI